MLKLSILFIFLFSIVISFIFLNIMPFLMSNSKNKNCNNLINKIILSKTQIKLYFYFFFK